MGIGSLHVESLTSYIGRLALAHNVLTGTLIGRLLAPAMNKQYLAMSSVDGGSRFYESSAPINGMGKEATDWITVIERLNLRTDLRYTTMLPWQGVLPVRNLIKDKRTWCPQCFSEQENGKEYEYLIWNLQIVKECPVHQIPLESHCPICGKQNYVISRRHIPGYCNRCWGWLGGSSGEVIRNDMGTMKSSNNYMALRDLHFLIESPLDSDTFGQMNTFRRINYILTHIAEGNISKLSTIIGKPKTTVWGWINAKNKPTLGDIYGLCSKLGITLQEFFFGELREISVIHNKPVKKNAVPISRKKPEDIDNLKAKLEKIIQNNISISMRQVARELKTDRRLLYKHFPELCKQIASSHTLQCGIEKAEKIENDCEKVKKAVQLLDALGVYPSRREVENIVGTPLLRRKEVQDYWRNMIITND